MANRGVVAQAIRGLLIVIMALGMNTIMISNSQAANLNMALLRLDRLQASTSTSFMVTFVPNTTAGIDRLVLALPAGFVISSPTVSTAGLDPGVTAVPGSLGISQSGTTLTVTGVGALTSGVLYGFTGGTVTNPVAGAYNATLATQNGATIIEQTLLGIPILSSDQIGVSGGNVPVSNRCGKADFNNDHKVNIFDLSILLSHYGRSGSVGDMNGDNKVNVFDLSIFLNCFGQNV